MTIIELPFPLKEILPVLFRSGENALLCVKGGAMKDHRGGEKLYHLAPLFSINVRANC